MIKDKYLCFKSKLQSMIDNSESLNSIGQMIFEDAYCNDLGRMIAKKYNVDHNEILAEVFLDLMNHKILVPVISKKQEFNGRIFKLTLTDIALRIQGKHFEELKENESQEVDSIIAITDDCKYDELLLHERYSNILEKKLLELLNYKDKLLINQQKVDINQFAEIIQLNVESILQKFGASRHNINNFKFQLSKLLDEYIQLYKFWYKHQETFIKKLIENYRNYKAIFLKLAPGITYKTFIGIMENPSVWDLQNLYNKFGDEICLM